jgi:hypothetical protein
LSDLCRSLFIGDLEEDHRKRDMHDEYGNEDGIEQIDANLPAKTELVFSVIGITSLVTQLAEVGHGSI